MDDLWAFDFKHKTWSLITPKGADKPAARYLHTTVLVGDSMVLYGGNQEHLGDVWSFHFHNLSWTRLSEVGTLLYRQPWQQDLTSDLAFLDCMTGPNQAQSEVVAPNSAGGRLHDDLWRQ